MIFPWFWAPIYHTYQNVKQSPHNDLNCRYNKQIQMCQKATCNSNRSLNKASFSFRRSLEHPPNYNQGSLQFGLLRFFYGALVALLYVFCTPSRHIRPHSQAICRTGSTTHQNGHFQADGLSHIASCENGYSYRNCAQ